jgi:fibronectin type 3 domain-containing protein
MIYRSQQRKMKETDQNQPLKSGIMEKRYIFLLAITLAIVIPAAPSFAQDQQPTAVSTENGIWIYLGNEIPVEFQYEVLRKEGTGDFRIIGTTTCSADPLTMHERAERYHPLFSHLEKPDDSDINYLLDYISRNRKTDTLYISNLPLMHLILGTALLDQEAEEGKTYQYMVRKITEGNPQSGEKPSNIIEYQVKTDILQPVFFDKQEGSSQIVLRWYIPELRNLNSFAVYRRVFGRGEFIKAEVERGFASSSDTIFLVAADTKTENPALYEYFVKPLDIYGNSGPDSEIISAGTVGSIGYPVAEYFNARGGNNSYHIELSWKLSSMKYVRTIEVYRGESFDGDYTLITRLSPQDTSYTDIVPQANENFYYYLVIKGPVESGPPSARVSAMFRNPGDKPLPPDEIGAETIPGGIKIHWSYREPHARGFYVYRYLYDKAEYNQISELIAPGTELYSFSDTSGSLKGNDIYRYAVRVVNDLEMISDFSESVSATPGIREIIEAPANLRITSTENGVLLIWDDMRDGVSGLLGYKLYRKTNPVDSWSLLPTDTLRHDVNYFNDTTLTEGNSYTWAVSAIDIYGNESIKSYPVTFRPRMEYFVSPPISKVVNTPDGIVISWEQITDQDVAYINIYRTQPGEESSVVARLEKESEEYLDTSVSEGQLYIYEISVVKEDGREYSRSRGVTIRRIAEADIQTTKL